MFNCFGSLLAELQILSRIFMYLSMTGLSRGYPSSPSISSFLVGNPPFKRLKVSARFAPYHSEHQAKPVRKLPPRFYFDCGFLTQYGVSLHCAAKIHAKVSRDYCPRHPADDSAAVQLFSGHWFGSSAYYKDHWGQKYHVA